ncbi:MAG: hypothetical protein HC941_24805 [Microcoleus sp. SU_5_3]|nr:hypothetical protein [Microcoleus sp. SU_5_3]
MGEQGQRRKDDEEGGGIGGLGIGDWGLGIGYIMSERWLIFIWECDRSSRRASETLALK